MKTLANCTPTEFLRQSLKIKRNVESWLTSDDIKEIRKRIPKLEKVSDSMTAEQKGEILVQNQVKLNEQATKNFFDILEVLMDKKEKETLAVLALCCFVEPSEVDNYPMDEYLGAIADLIENPNVLRFFSSLAQLGQTNISIASRK